jgi:hypothetical protein
MALKLVLKKLTEVDEALRSLYKQVGDEFVLETDDNEYKQRIGEFRNTNIDLNKQISDLNDQMKGFGDMQKTLKGFEGLDAAEARKAMDTMQQLADKKLIEAGKLDEVLEQRTGRMKSDYEGQIKALTASLDDQKKEGQVFKSKLTEVVIDNSLQAAVSRTASVRPGAMQDIISRGRGVWSINDDGTPVPTGGDGKVMYGKDGKTTLSMEEWAQSLVSDASYLFEPSSGGGSGGGMGGNQGAGGKVVSMGDQDSLNANIADIAAGKVTVGE